MGSQQKPESLISLKLVLFLFYGGLGALYCTLTPHMDAIGLKYEESRLILIFAPLMSIVGPLVAGPLADRIASKTLTGKYLRILAALSIVCAAILYSLLLIVPPSFRGVPREPLVTFGCDGNGAIIFQERCTEEKTCSHWENERVGSLKLINCTYTCQNPKQFEKLYNPWEQESALVSSPVSVEVSKERSDDYDYDDNARNDFAVSRERARTEADQVYVEPPHLCTTTLNENGKEVIKSCHVYTEDSDAITVQASLRGATNKENDTHSAEWCNYPLDGWKCNIPKQQAIWMMRKKSSDCKPMIECAVLEPYVNPQSVLADSLCVKIIGDVDATLTSYFVIRLLAEIFPTAAVTLLNAAIIVATRETSTGRGDVGRQLAFGSLGWAVFPFIIGVSGIRGELLVPVIVFAVAMILAAIILIVAQSMPVSPPEWWWHTKSGMLAIPMSAIRKYGPEIAAIAVVAVLLGIFWSIIDSYQMWYFLEQGCNHWTGFHHNISLNLSHPVVNGLTEAWGHNISEALGQNFDVNVAQQLSRNLSEVLRLNESSYREMYYTPEFSDNLDYIIYLNDSASDYFLKFNKNVTDIIGLYRDMSVSCVESHLALKLAATVLALPAIGLLWNSERLVDYCGHSNILMVAFTLYVIRYFGLAVIKNPLYALFFNALEPITLSISWVTLMLYMRHLMPRRLTATGQAIPVIAFFGIGKCLGAVIGYVDMKSIDASFRCLCVSCSIAAAIVAALYFCLYHCLLAPRCAAKPQPPPSHSELQGHANGGGHNGNSNGNYSPLRVYHNGMSRKGQFRY